MEQFASGWKRNYYGKGDVIAYRLNRDGVTPEGQSPVFGANVQLLVYGDAFWPTYTTGDNTGLVATDSMKNFIQRETLNFAGSDLEAYCRFLTEKFLATYEQVEGAQVSAVEIPYRAIPGQSVSFAPSGPECLTARVEMNKTGIVETASGIKGFRMVRLGGSAFYGFVRDQYTTLPEIKNRPLNMWLDLEWHYMAPENAISEGRTSSRVRDLILETFGAFESGSIQQVIYQIGIKMLAEIPTISEIHLEANNRTWDAAAEQGETLAVFTDARPAVRLSGAKVASRIMARLSTHVLDTARGLPAEGVSIELRSDSCVLVSNVVTNRDGRTDQPLLSGPEIPTGLYELIFHAGDYLRRFGLATERPHFLETIPIRFHLSDPLGNYHIPLLLSPFGYSTYRGS